jgi:hypothetical protein
MRFAHRADALQIAGSRRLEQRNFFRIELKRSHAAQQEVRGFGAFPGHRAQFGRRHANVPRHALDF